MKIKLSDLNLDQKSEIESLHGAASVVMRLRELGFIPGEHVTLRGRAPFGEPLLVEVRGSVIALRTQEADCLAVKELK